MTSKLLARTLLALALAGSLRAAAQEEPAEPPAAVPVHAAGTGTLEVVGAGVVPLAWIESESGLRVELAPIVARLGGRLEPGPLGASWVLTLGEVAFVLAHGSPAVTHGDEIVTLSGAPVERAGTLWVPLDLVDATYGALLGVTSSWDPAARRLTLARPQVRELPVEISMVHVQGVTTVVLRLPDALRYRIEQRPGTIDVVPLHDHFLPVPPRATAGDPLLGAVRVYGDRVRLELAAEVEADDYALHDPFRIVIDLFRAREAPAAETPEPPPAAARRGVHTVVIDPGHGGEETGAVGPAGTMEKDLTLSIARALAERLRSELGLRVVLTRDDDVALPLDARSALANQNKADLFLSIHLNSTVGGRAHGAETYFLSLQASDERAAGLAAAENLGVVPAAAPGSEEFDLQLLLWDLAQSRHLEASQRLASLIQAELNSALELPDRGVKQAPFRVLTGAAMPAVLVELGFLSHRDEEQRLRNPGYRAELVATLVRAVGRFRAELESSAAPAAGARP